MVERGGELPFIAEGVPTEAELVEGVLELALKLSARSHSPYWPALIFCKLASSALVEHDFSR